LRRPISRRRTRIGKFQTSPPGTKQLITMLPR
jgi:hypothetical protein